MSYHRKNINNNMSVWEVLRELMFRVCDMDERPQIPQNFAQQKLEFGDNVRGVNDVRYVRTRGMNGAVNIFVQYRNVIEENDPIRDCDIYKRGRYLFRPEKNAVFSCSALDGDGEPKAYYLLRNLGWKGFDPLLDYFADYIETQERDMLRQRINSARQEEQDDDEHAVGVKDTHIGEIGKGGHMDVHSPVYNRLVFGAPGTGKSYKLETERKQDADFRTNYERVTFYPTYSYAQFVGTYKPTMNGDKIAYKFVPGPFLRLLVKAIAAPEKKFLLLIEEINRTNAAAVFGDVFQLLDRKEGESEYPVAASEDVKAFLVGELEKRNSTSGFEMTKENGVWTGDCVLSLPNNLYIWATMNSADQGVFPLDTAFKRRWDFEYIGVDGHDLFKNDNDAKRPVKWEATRKFLNRLLVLHNVNEDKLMGPYFVKPDAEGNVPFAAFASKVLMYIWEDAARMCRRQLFGEGIGTYAELVGKWRHDGGKIFAKVMEETGVGGKDDECMRLYADMVNHDADNAVAN